MVSRFELVNGFVLVEGFGLKDILGFPSKRFWTSARFCLTDGSDHVEGLGIVDIVVGFGIGDGFGPKVSFLIVVGVWYRG